MSRPKGTGCVYQRGDVLWIKYSRNGRSFCESAKTGDSRRAHKLLKVRLAEITTGTFIGPEIERIRVEELAEDFLREYRVNGRKSVSTAETRWLIHINPFFGHLRTVDVTAPLIARYIDQRQQQGAKNATINRELAALRRMFRLGRDNQKVRGEIPKFPRLAENNVRKGFLEDGQYHKLIASCSELWFRAFLEVARTYGWRVSELLNMKASQVDVFNRVIRLEPGTTKNKDGREVAMTDAVYLLLAQCITGKNQNDHVFTRSDGSPVLDFRHRWWNSCKEAGIGSMACRACKATADNGSICQRCGGTNLKYEGLLVHDLRRTAARALRRAGVAEGVIMRIGGWKTRSVFERYAIVTQDDIKDAIMKLQVSEQKAGNGYNFGYSEAPATPVAGSTSTN